MKSENMKKIYLKPETVETQIELQQMIAGSEITGDGTTNWGNASEGSEGEGGDSRYFDDWD